MQLKIPLYLGDWLLEYQSLQSNKEKERPEEKKGTETQHPFAPGECKVGPETVIWNLVDTLVCDYTYKYFRKIIELLLCYILYHNGPVYHNKTHWYFFF